MEMWCEGDADELIDRLGHAQLEQPQPDQNRLRYHAEAVLQLARLRQELPERQRQQSRTLHWETPWHLFCFCFNLCWSTTKTESLK